MNPITVIGIGNLYAGDDGAGILVARRLKAHQLEGMNVIEAGIEHVTHALGVADFDLDGALDVVTAEMHQGQDPDEVRVYRNTGGGAAFAKQILGTTGSHAVRLADLGADGDIDVFGANWTQTTSVWAWVTSPGSMDSD